MTGLAKPLAGFLREYLPHERGVSPHTVESYVTSFRMLVTFVAESLGTQPCRLEVRDIGTGNLLQFPDHLETGRGNCVNTRNVRLAAVKAFFRYPEFRHPEHLDLAAQVRAIPLKKGDRRVVDCLTRGEIRALLSAPRAATRTGLRDRAMLCLAYNAGLRVSEPVSLHVGSVSQPELDLVRVMGKGRRERILPLWKETGDALRGWLGARPDSPDPHLFLNSRKTGMTARGFAKRLAVHVEAAASDAPSIADRTVTPHTLRHACALHTLEATGDIRKVALWLGHASVVTTEAYLQADPAAKLEILSQQRPPDLQKGTFRGVQDQLMAMLAQ